VLTRESMRTLLDAHTAGRQPLGRAIWTLLNLDVWWRRTCERILAATDAPAIRPRRVKSSNDASGQRPADTSLLARTPQRGATSHTKV